MFLVSLYSLTIRTGGVGVGGGGVVKWVGGGGNSHIIII
jgi:hypothetical protein